MSFGLITDNHFSTPSVGGVYELIWAPTWDGEWRVFASAEDRLDAALTQMVASNISTLFIAGDVVDMGIHTATKTANVILDEIVAQITAHAFVDTEGGKVAVIRGNHDETFWRLAGTDHAMKDWYDKWDPIHVTRANEWAYAVGVDADETPRCYTYDEGGIRYVFFDGEDEDNAYNHWPGVATYTNDLFDDWFPNIAFTTDLPIVLITHYAFTDINHADSPLPAIINATPNFMGIINGHDHRDGGISFGGNSEMADDNWPTFNARGDVRSPLSDRQANVPTWSGSDGAYYIVDWNPNSNNSVLRANPVITSFNHGVPHAALRFLVA